MSDVSSSQSRSSPLSNALALAKPQIDAKHLKKLEDARQN